MALTPTNGQLLAEGGTCQVCGDSKAAKVSFKAEPLCQDWHGCSRRSRRKTRTVYRAPDGTFATASTYGAQLELVAA